MSFLRSQLPAWAQEGGTEAMLARLRNPEDRERMRNDLSGGDEARWGRTFVSSTNKRIDGKTIARLAAERNVEPALLKAIAWCETRLDPCSVSPSGAQGLMQFMPATFAGYAVDGDHDGVTDAWDYHDAIYSAAAYLCTSGARGGAPDGIRDALLAYNHAQWYVDLVLAARSAIASRNPD